tara:strand:+ start:881 stop:1282 length:402 start_codon:yes stop_codon:yes gene_type:complete
MSKLQGISVKIPLVYSQEDGPYELNKNIGDVVKQNLKNLILTNPGERPMIRDFGVGFHRLLFEPVNSRLLERINTNILKQVGKYMPFLNIEDVIFITSDENDGISNNEISVTIKYNLGDLNPTETLTITSNND